MSLRKNKLSQQLIRTLLSISLVFSSMPMPMPMSISAVYAQSSIAENQGKEDIKTLQVLLGKIKGKTRNWQKRGMQFLCVRSDSLGCEKEVSASLGIARVTLKG